MEPGNLMGLILKNNKYFLFPLFVILIFSSICIAIRGNSELYFFVNQNHSEFADFLFLSFTKLGNGTMAFLLVFILLWVSFREALSVLIITLLITILITLLKKYIFPDYHRPLYILGEQMVRLVPGYNPPKLHTFPSGHTATAFSVCLYLSFLARQNGIKFTLLLTAIMIGYSRIYLSAHFPADVIGGAVVAILITLPVYFYSRKIKKSWIDRKLIFNLSRTTSRQTA